ncbi:phage/plasmid primase, P4 family [Aquibium sp. LZ166]|uniref:Phage/plasmid primase, P4 family n=1 Tax=Aquibium pacificus TaxID=3153579 RepID=A0ABV3ST23_9HYPH
MLQFALQLAEINSFGVFPVTSPLMGGPDAGKKPLIRGWQKAATTDPDQIRQLFCQRPDANIGIATGSYFGIFVLDVDVKNDGLKSLKQLREEIDLPETLTARTGSGGYHFYFRYPPGMQLRNSAGRLGSGLDIRGDGGLVVAPPSLHKCGERYEWENSLPVVEAPELVARLMTKPSRVAKTSIIQPGNRNSSLTSIAGRLRRNGADVGRMNDELQALNGQLEDPLPTDEVESIAQSVSRYQPAWDLTEQGVANIFAEGCRDRFRYSPSHGWLGFNDKVWEQDQEGLKVQETVKLLLDKLQDRFDTDLTLSAEMRTEYSRKVNGLRRSAPIGNIAKLARSTPSIVDTSEWSDHAHLLNFQNGTLDLRTMKLREHDPADRLRVVLPYDYDPAAEAPLFSKVLGDALDEDCAGFLLRLYGYSLSGAGGEQVLAILVGPGKNGKSTIAEAIRHALGGYARTANPETFMRQQNQSAINNDVADLNGARLVTTSELSADQKLDAALVKRMTGGERMKARFLHKEYFEFDFNALIVMVSNFAPLFDGSDTGIARRLQFVPFENVVPDDAVDKHLESKLRNEAPGIMNLLLRGYQEYRAQGLNVPSDVRRKTDEMVEDRNLVLRFVRDCCELADEANVAARSLFGAFEEWLFLERAGRMSERAFKAAIERTCGLCQKRVSAGQQWVGIRLKAA